MNNKNTSTLTELEKQQLKQLHDTGYAFLLMMKMMPDHISIKYSGYFNSRGRRKYTSLQVAKFVSATKAILNETDPKIWESYWNKNGKN